MKKKSKTDRAVERAFEAGKCDSLEEARLKLVGWLAGNPVGIIEIFSVGKWLESDEEEAPLVAFGGKWRWCDLYAKYKEAWKEAKLKDDRPIMIKKAK